MKRRRAVLPAECATRRISWSSSAEMLGGLSSEYQEGGSLRAVASIGMLSPLSAEESRHELPGLGREYTRRFFDASGSERTGAGEPRGLRAQRGDAARGSAPYERRPRALCARAHLSLFVIAKMRQVTFRKNLT